MHITLLGYVPKSAYKNYIINLNNSQKIDNNIIIILKHIYLNVIINTSDLQERRENYDTSYRGASN